MQSAEQLLAPKRSDNLEQLPKLKSSDDCVKQLSILFVEALTEGGTRNWTALLNYFDAITPDFLPTICLHPVVQHYAHRTVQYAIEHPEALGIVDVCGKFAALFPNLIGKLVNEELTCNPSSTPRRSVPVAVPAIKRRHCSLVVGNELHQLLDGNTSNLPLTFRAPSVKVSDLDTAAKDVFDEISKTKWRQVEHPPSKVAAIGHLSLPLTARKRPTLEPVFQSEGDAVPGASVSKKLSTGNLGNPQSVMGILSKGHLETMHDVIEAFATGKIPSGSESIYLNYSNTEPWNPYSLQIVPKTKVDPEHFIASKFGLLRVYPDGENDLQSFANWSREASMFCLLQQIPFFRHFLLHKALWIWRRNARRHQFNKLLLRIESSCVKYYPILNDGLLKVQNLCEELSTVSFYTMTPLGNYSITTYNDEISFSKSKVQELLSRYFKYCSRVIIEAVSYMQDLLSELEKKRNHHPLVCDLPLSVQKQNYMRMEKEFQLIQHRASKIRNYISLAEHIIISCLLHLAQKNAKQWLQLTLEPQKLMEIKVDPSKAETTDLGNDTDKDKALLCIHVRIEKESGTLVAQPSADELNTIFTGPLSLIPELISNAVRPLCTGTSSLSSSRASKVTAKMDRTLELISHSGDLESNKARSRLASVKALEGKVVESHCIHLLPTILTAEDVRTTLCNDETHVSNMKTLKGHMIRVNEELKTICTQYHWLCEVNSYILALEAGVSTVTFLSAQEFESCLSKLHFWRRSLESLPSKLVLGHGLLAVQLSSVTQPLLLGLTAALLQVQEGTLVNTRSLQRMVLEQAKQFHERMSTTRDDLEGIAQHAKLLREATVFQQREAAKVIYILGVHQALSRYGVEVPAHDRSGAQELRMVWEAFEGKLKDASQFLATQTPLKTSELQHSISTCENEMKALIATVYRKPFTDPSAAPSEVIGEMKQLQDKLISLRSKMLELSRWKEAMTGKYEDHAGMASLMDTFFVRRELWKYRRAYDSVEREWMKTPFKKLEISVLAKYIKESLSICSKLQETLPPKDPVLEAWKVRLLEFQKGIPLLEQISSKSLKISHWQTIFAALGQDYDHSQPYTLTDFSSYSIYEHSDIIAEICHDALQEEKIKNQVARTEERWEQMTITISSIPLGIPLTFALSERQRGGASRKAGDKTTTFALDIPPSQHNTPNKQTVLTISNGPHVQLTLEDNITHLKVLLDSPHSTTMRSRMEAMLSILRQLGELFMSLMDALRKWLDMLALFSSLEESTRPSYGLETLQTASDNLQEIMESIREDPRVLSLLSKKRGQTGVRDLQGESLRANLDAVHGMLNSLLSGIQLKLFEASAEFPRLFYLSTREVLSVLSHKGNPAALAPLIRKMFPAIEAIHFTEVPPSESHGLEADEGFQAISIEGSHDQCLKLVQPLPLGSKLPPQWMRALETAIQYSIACQFSECQAAKPAGLFSHVMESNGELQATSLKQWLSGHLIQSTAMVTHATWDQAIWNALTMQQRSHIAELKTKMAAVLAVASKQLLQQNQQLLQLPHSLVLALQTFISILNHKLTLIQSVLKNEELLPIPVSLHYSLIEGQLPMMQSSSRQNMASVKGSHVHLGEQVSLSRPLEYSSHSLVASSKSLRSSRYSLSANDLQRGRAVSPRDDTSPNAPCPAKCMVHCGDVAMPYGYEFLVPGEEPLLSLVTESCVVSLAIILSKHEMGILTGDYPERKAETTFDMAKILGRHCYQLQCVSSITEEAIIRVVTGAVLSGSILLLRSFDSLKLSVLIPFGKVIHGLYQAIAKAFENRPDLLGSNPSGSIPVSISSAQVAQLHKPASCLDWYKMSSEKKMENRELDWDMMGIKLKINPSFGCAMVLSSSKADIPQNIKDLWRPVELLIPSDQYIAEILLLCLGYSEASLLGRKLVTFLDHIKSQLGLMQGSLNSLKGILHLLRAGLKSAVVSPPTDVALEEKHAIYRAVIKFYRNRVNSTDMETIKELFRSSFPEIPMKELHAMEPLQEELIQAIKMQLSEQHLQQLPELIEKTVQLHQSLQSHRCVVLCGPAQSGKSTTYRTLAATYRHLNSERGWDFPLINVTTLNMEAYTPEQLFGSFQDNGQWKDGILARMFNQLHEEDYLKNKLKHTNNDGTDSFSNIKHWLVLDGPLEMTYGDFFASLLSGQGVYHLPNGSTIALPVCCQLILETDSFDALCPSLLHHSAAIHYRGENVVTYEALINTWLEKAPTHHNLTSMSVEILASMIKGSLPEAMEFIFTVSYLPGTSSSKMWLTQALLGLLSALLKKGSPSTDTSICTTSTSSGSKTTSRASSRPVSTHTSQTSLRAGTSFGGSISAGGSSTTIVQQASANDDMSEVSDDPDFHLELSSELQMASVFAMAYIWSMAGYLPFSQLPAFNDFARSQLSQLLYTVPLPEEGSLFDYCLDMNTYHFVPWTERNVGKKPSSGQYVALPEVERYAYLTDLYLSYGLNVIIIGDHGTGKSALVEHLIQTRVPLTKIVPTSGLRLSSLQLQRIITDRISQLQKRTGSQKSKQSLDYKCMFFIDDLHTVCSESQGEVNSVAETLHYIMSSSVIMDPVRNYKHSLYNVQYIATCSSPDVPYLNPRMMAVFHRVPLLPPTENVMFKIVLQSIKGWVESFPIESIVSPLAEAITSASVVAFCSVSARYTSTLSRPHFSFTLHDLMCVCKGLLLLSPHDKAQMLPQFGLQGRRGGRDKKVQPTGKTSRKGKTNQAPIKDGAHAKLRNKSKLEPSQSKALSEMDQQKTVQIVRTIIRLWCHENTRVYADRMVDDSDRSWFQMLLEGCVRYVFCGNGTQDLSAPQQGDATAMQNEKPGRRGKGGRGRANIPQQSSGLSAEELIKMGIKVDLAQKLILPNPETPVLRQLIMMEQVAMKGEDLTGLMFAKFPSSVSKQEQDCSGSTSRDSPGGCIETSDSLESCSRVPYSELGDGQVMETVKSHLSLEYGKRTVLFKTALEHVTRLCRVISLRGSHGLLLGSSSTGRKSLVILASKVMNAKLFSCSQRITGAELKKCLKDVCISAGLERENTVLMVSKNADDWNGDLWENICRIMEEGLSPSLFSSSELLVMGSKVQANRLKKTVENTYHEFAASVRKRLHVFVVWDTYSGSPFRREKKWQSKMTRENSFSQEECERAVFTMIFKSCTHVDYYHPWNKLSYGDIALHVWQESTSPKWEEWASSSSQLEAVSLLAAHVHITTIECLHSSFSSNAPDLISPGTFLDCLSVTTKLAVKLVMEQKQKAEKLQSALAKLKDLDEAIGTLQKELELLRPQKAAADQEVQQRMALITAAKERYMAASKRCKDAEETIQTETKNVELYTQIVKEKFEVVSPLYQSSLEVLSSVTAGDILELMSYRVPPLTLEPVLHALCMLFDRPQTWEDCKQLLLTQNFYENLKFFDKDNVDDYKIQKLEKIIAKTSKFEGLEESSKGIVPLCNWLIALANYYNTKMIVEPLREKLRLAENKRLEALETFVSMRKDMEETKNSMEETIRFHKESVQKAAGIEGTIMDISSQLSRANNVLQAFAQERQLWNEKLQELHDHTASAPGHALLSAANICYLQCVPADQHQSLKKNWLLYCHGVVPFGSLSLSSEHSLHPSSRQPLVKVQKDFSVYEVFSSQEERFYWRKERVFFDSIVQDRVLAARAYSQLVSLRWPLVCDPHKQFCQLLKIVEEGQSSTLMGTNAPDCLVRQNEPSPCLVIGKISDLSFPSKLSQLSSKDVAVVLVLDAITNNCSQNIIALLDKGRAMEPGSVIHPNFRLYIVIEHHLEDITTMLLLHSVSQQFSSFSVINLDLARSGLFNYFHRLIMDRERPGYSNRIKSLETDWTLHHQRLELQQDSTLAAVCTLSGSLLASSSVIQTLAQSKAIEASTMAHISETTKTLQSFQQQAELYMLVAKQATIIFKVVQQLSSALKYLSFDIVQFEALLFDVVGKEHVLDHISATNGHVLHVIRKLGLSVHTYLQRKTFRRHHLLFPLLLGLEILLSSGQATLEEVKLLGQTSEPIEEMIDLCLRSEVKVKSNVEEGSNLEERSNVERPQWIDLKEWCSVLEIQKCVPSLKNLAQLLSGNSKEWKEYLNFEPSFLDSSPTLRELSLLQKLLIWKILKPEMFYHAACQFVTLVLGAEFTRTYSSNFNTLISEFPQICICAFQEQDINKATETITHALSLDFEIHSMIADKDMKILEANLPQLIRSNSCVLVEHLHHHGGWTDKLKLLLKMLNHDGTHDDNHFNSKFRMWIILPVSKVADLELNALDCPVAIMEIDTGKQPLTLPECSSQLIDDFETIQKASFSQKLVPWEHYETLVTKLMQLIPFPLQEMEYGTYNTEKLRETELRHCLKQQHNQHPLLRPFIKELHEHSVHAAKLHCSLTALQDTLKGNRSFMCSTPHLLTAIFQNRVPSVWNYLADMVSAQEEQKNELRLLPLLQLHRYRMLFYSNHIQQGCPPPAINILCFSKPDTLQSVLCLTFAEKHNIPLQNVHIHAELSATEPKEHGGYNLTLHGMKLSQAQWSEKEHYLHMGQNTDVNQMMFIVLKAIPEIPPRGCKCPIYCPKELGCGTLRVPLDIVFNVSNDCDSLHDMHLCCNMPYVNI